MPIKQMQNTLYKFCSQFDEESFSTRDKDYLLYNESDQRWCNIYFEKYTENYRFESPSFSVQVGYCDGGEDIRMAIAGDADELFEHLEANFELLTDNVRNQVEEYEIIY